MSGVKQQHYIPRAAYLEHFRVPDEERSVVWRCQRSAARTFDIAGQKKLTTKDFCKEHYLYESPNLPPNSLENILEEIETGYRAVLDGRILKQEALAEEELQSLTMFLASLEVRVPASRDKVLKSCDKVLNLNAALEKQHLGGAESAATKKWLESKETAFSLLVMKAVLIDRWQFASFKFLFVPEIAREDVFFVASDNPVTLHDFVLMNSVWHLQPFSKSLELTLPLTPYLLLFANNRGLTGYSEVDYNFVDEANSRTVKSANKHLISPRRRGEEWFERLQDRSTQSFILSLTK